MQVWGDAGDTAVSDTAWFETPMEKEWDADWITPSLPKEVQVTLIKKFSVDRPVAKARMYMVGLGLYELVPERGEAGRGMPPSGILRL